MSRAPFEFVDVLPSEHPNSDGGSSCRVRGNHLPFGHILYVEHSVSFSLNIPTWECGLD